MEALIAKLSLFGKRPGEPSFLITIEIGTPYKFLKEPEEWVCPVSLAPLYSRKHDVHAGDSFQALSLAIALIGNTLWDFRDKGGHLSYDGTSDDFPLDAYSFKAIGRK